MKLNRHESEITQPRQFQRGYEFILFWATVLLCVFHMTLCTYRYVIWDYLLPQKIDKWLGVMLVLGFVGYLVFFFPYSTFRLRNVFQRLRTFEYGFLFFLPFWYVLSCVLRQITTGNPSIRENNWWIYITFLTSLILFPLAGFAGPERAKKVIDPMMKFILIPNLVFTAWILWKYFHLDYVTFPSGSKLEMTADFGLAIGENRLHTANRALTMLSLCIYLVAREHSWRRIPYAVGIPVFFTTLVLTNNRGGWYASLILFVMLAFVLPWHGLRQQPWYLRFFAGLLSIAVCLSFLHWYRGEMFRVLDSALQSSESEIAVPAAAEPVIQPTVLKVGRVPAVETGVQVNLASEEHVRTFETGLSSRMPIYRECIRCMLSSDYLFLFGVTHADVGTTLYQAGYLRQVYPSAHNFFLQMGVAFGVPVMLASIVFVALLLLRCWRIMFRVEELFPGARMIPLVIIPMLAADMVDTTLTAGSSITCAVFYLFAGWVVAMDLEQKSVAPDKKVTN